MNNIPLTFLKDVNVAEHITIGENLLILLGISVFTTLLLLLADDFDTDAILPACMTGVIMGVIILLLFNLIPFERTDRQYVSKPLTVESISNTSEPDDYVVEVSDGKKSYIITDIKELEELNKSDRFYLKATVESVSEMELQEKRYTLNQLKDSQIKIIRIKENK